MGFVGTVWLSNNKVAPYFGPCYPGTSSDLAIKEKFIPTCSRKPLIQIKIILNFLLIYSIEF